MERKVVEILQYALKKDTGTDFHQIMHKVSVPLHARHSIKVISYGNSLHDVDSYYLIRAFDSEDHMSELLADFYSGNDWQNGPREDIISRIENSLKTVLALPQSTVEELRKK